MDPQLRQDVLHMGPKGGVAYAKFTRGGQSVGTANQQSEDFAFSWSQVPPELAGFLMARTPRSRGGSARHDGPPLERIEQSIPELA
jgi:hypothetical protein